MAETLDEGVQRWRTTVSPRERETMSPQIGQRPVRSAIWAAVSQPLSRRTFSSVMGAVPVWTRSVLEENKLENLEWGVSASPLVAGDLVIVTGGNTPLFTVLAYDRNTGELKWKVPLGEYARLKARGFRSRIHVRATRNHPL